MANPPVLPGSMVLWQEDSGDFLYALVIQVEEHLDNSCYVLTVIRDLRIKTLTFFHTDYNKKWRLAVTRGP